MKRYDLDEFDTDFIIETVNEFEKKKTIRKRKRRWREIESLKENQRLKRELAEFDQY